MKNLYIFLIVQLLLSSVVFANSYNTIAIDGNNSGWATDEQFTNCSSADNAYFTWDAEYIYIGIADAEAAYNKLATFVYFDTDPLGSSGATSAWAWGGSSNFITCPFYADFSVVWGENEDGNYYIEVMEYNNGGGSWDQKAATLTSSNTLVVSSETVVEFAIGTNYREVKIKRSYIGSPDEIKTSMFTEQQYGSNWRYFAWPGNDWPENGQARASGQSIPHYYGFFLESGISPNRVPYYDASFNQWTGEAKSTSWATSGNWTDGVPASSTLVKLPSTATVIVDAAGAECDDMLIKTGGTLTVNTDGTITINGGLYNYTGYTGVVVESSTSANGSLIQHQYGSALMTVGCYTTAGQWHSFAAPVSGLISQDLYLNATPEVWLAEYDEATRDYTFISSLTESIGDMKGWMLWVGGTGSNTYGFEGAMRTGTIGSDNNMVRSQANGTDDYGFNYVGNPFTSAIDWDASSGWIKTNLNNAIYIFNDGGWATYINGAGVNDGSQYIAMNQGFFVQVADGGGPYDEYGTLKMDVNACVHNTVGYLKETTAVDSLIRLQLDHFGSTDETVIRFQSESTAGFDGQWDAHKFFSHSENRPLIYSTTGGAMSINSLPFSNQEVELDVQGIDGVGMTISTTEVTSVNSAYLLDKLTGIETDIIQQDYSFTYDQSFVDRFTLHFTTTGNQEITEPEMSFNAYSTKGNILIQINNDGICEISIVNLLGQQVFHSQSSESKIVIPVNNSGFYLVNVKSGEKISTKKVFVK